LARRTGFWKKFLSLLFFFSQRFVTLKRIKMDESDENISVGNEDKKSSKGLLRKEAELYKEKLEKRGVIYMSRVPPFMKPNKARNMFEQYGEVTRLYLAEEGMYFSFMYHLLHNILYRTTRYRP
jgi:hypothetical protein